MPKMFFSSMEEVPNDFREMAKTEDGKVVIDVVAKTQLDEFRDRNIAVSRERDDASALVSRLQTELGFTPEDLDTFLTSFGDMKSVAQQVADGKLVKDTSLAEAIEQRTSQMRQQYENDKREASIREGNLTKERDNLRQDVNRSIIDREVMQAASDPKSGIRPDAIKAVLREAYDFYQVVDGKLVPKDGEGNVIYGTDGVNPMKPLEFFHSKLAADAPFLFKPSEGGGATGGSGMGGMTPAQLADLSPAQKMDLARSQG